MALKTSTGMDLSKMAPTVITLISHEVTEQVTGSNEAFPLSYWKEKSSFPQPVRLLLLKGEHHGLNIPPPQYVGILVPKTSECELIWKQGYCRCNSLR